MVHIVEHLAAKEPHDLSLNTALISVASCCRPIRHTPLSWRKIGYLFFIFLGSTTFSGAFLIFFIMFFTTQYTNIKFSPRPWLLPLLLYSNFFATVLCLKFFQHFKILLMSSLPFVSYLSIFLTLVHPTLRPSTFLLLQAPPFPFRWEH